MRWQDLLATVFIIVAAGVQSAFSSASPLASSMNLPMVAVALLSTYPRVHIVTLVGAVLLTRLAISTESIPVTIFRSVLSTLLSIKAGLSLINHGWLLAVVTVTSCIVIDLIAAIIAHPKYVGTLATADIVVSLVFNAGITLLCAIPLEIYYRQRHIHGF